MIYLCYGENDFLIRRAVNSRVAKFSHENSADAVTKIDADDFEPNKLISEIISINMFTPRRLIVLRGAENSKSTWDMVGENLTRVPDETDLIIVANSPDKRTKTFKNLQKIAEIQEFTNPKPYEMKKFVLDEANLQRVEIRPDAVEKLVELTSGDGENQLARIASEIAKMAALNQVIDVNLVSKTVEPDIAANVFKILEMALGGRRDTVKNEIDLLRKSGENANKFFGLLVSQVFALAGAIFGADAADLKISPFQLNNARDMARRLGDNAEQKTRVRQIVRKMAATDAKMKLSNADDAWTLIEILLATI